MEDIYSLNRGKLGFGLMRLPKDSSGAIDEKETARMVDLFLEKGFTYFDTAYAYPGSEENSNIFEYSILRNNVNKLKIIQLGITVCTASGQVATDYPTWQFNFKFNPE